MNRTGSLGLARALLAVALAAVGVAGCKREEPIVFAAPTSPPPAAPAAAPGAPAAAPPAAAPPAAAPPAAAPAAAPFAGAPAAAPPGAAEDPHIAAAQLVLARDPKNVKAWIALGNEYFDSHQPQKAIDAYARALELEPKNPDVLTDQGVMYRDVGAFDKAIANFQRASKIDPHHVQSLYNLGVVYAYDLKDARRAAEAWNRVVQVAPTSQQAAEARKLLDEMKQAPSAR